jgi:hypothetical protein
MLGIHLLSCWNLAGKSWESLAENSLFFCAAAALFLGLPSGKHTKKLWKMDENGPVIVDLPIRNGDFQ